MSKGFIKKLIERLDAGQTILKSDRVEQSYVNNRDALVTLLSDHPDFVKQIKLLRVRYELPENGIDDEQEAFQWEHQDKVTRSKLVSEIEEFLIDFTFNAVYRSDIKQYTYEMVVCPSRSLKWSTTNIPSMVIVDTDEDKNINAHLITPNSRYIQIFDWTTLKDIEKNWTKIKQTTDKSVSQNSGDELRRNIWKLKDKGLNYKEIHREFRDTFKHLVENHSGGILDESRIGIYAKRYEESLKRLKDF